MVCKQSFAPWPRGISFPALIIEIIVNLMPPMLLTGGISLISVAIVLLLVCDCYGNNSPYTSITCTKYDECSHSGAVHQSALALLIGIGPFRSP